MRSVTFSRREETWLIRGEIRGAGVEGQLVLANDELATLNASDLRAALAGNAEFYGRTYVEADVSPLPEAHLDADLGGGRIGFEFRDGTLFVAVLHVGEWPEDLDEDAQVEKLSRLVRPYLVHKRATLAAASPYDPWSGPLGRAIQLHIKVSTRGRTAQDLYDIGEATLKLCDALSSGFCTHDIAADFVRGGAPELLIGLPEGNWLDVKSQEYDLASTRGKIGLAQAVARFCNGEDGGVIVIGAHAKKIPGGEEIRSVPGVAPRYNDTEARYRRVLDRHLYPPVWGLRIDVVPTTDGQALISIDLPPQPEELKPFLVHGAITADDETEGSFISIVQRRGEGSIPHHGPDDSCDARGGTGIPPRRRQPASQR